MDHQTLELVFVGVAAVALLLQTIMLTVLVVILSKAAKSAHNELENFRSSVMPVIYNTRDLVARVAPKFEEAADELTAITRSLRAQTADVQAAATEVIGRAQRMTRRVDGMATKVLDTVEHAAEFVSGTVIKPVRQFSGVLASVKAIVESLRASDSASRDHTVRDPAAAHVRHKDMFV